MAQITDKKLHAPPRTIESWEGTPEAKISEHLIIFLGTTWDNLGCYSVRIKSAPGQNIGKQFMLSFTNRRPVSKYIPDNLLVPIADSFAFTRRTKT
jgi:hypothetical protein